VVSTANLPLGGGRDFPTTEDAQLRWATSYGNSIGTDRALQLLLRYGTRAQEFIHEIAANGETKLSSNPDYSDTEIHYLITSEQVSKVDDIVHRRTNLAFSGELTDSLVTELERILTKSQSGDNSSNPKVQLKLDEGSRL
jgi:glycerol-3-phosphate dehydrogenase